MQKVRLQILLSNARSQSNQSAWPQENQGRNAGDDCRKAHEPRDDFRSRKKFFRSNDKRDDNHHEGIHHSQNELDRHWRSAAETTGRTLFTAKPKTGFALGA
jgi:hypothetical protein